MDDFNYCAKVLDDAEGLPRWQRHLVTRRLTRLFGATTVEMCGLHGEFAVDPQASMGVMINRQFNASRHPGRFTQPDRGTFDAALRCEPDSVQIAALIASLEY